MEREKVAMGQDDWGGYCLRCSTEFTWIRHMGYRCPKEDGGEKVHAVEFYSNGKVKRIEFVDGGVRYASLGGFIDEALPRIPLSVEPVAVTVTIGGEGQPRFAVEVARS